MKCRILFSGISKCLLKCLPNMLNVNTKKSLTCNDKLLLHSNSEGQDQLVHPHSLVWIFSRLFLSIHILYSIH